MILRIPGVRSLIWVKEKLRRLIVELSQLEKLHHVDPALTRLTF